MKDERIKIKDDQLKKIKLFKKLVLQPFYLFRRLLSINEYFQCCVAIFIHKI